MAKDPETGLTDKALKATRLYIANYLDRKNSNYTFSQAMRDAGYKDSYIDSHAHKLWGDVRIQRQINERIAELEQKTELTVHEVLKDLAYGLQLAKQKDDLAAIARFSELRGKFLSMFSDRLILDPERYAEKEEMTEREAVLWDEFQKKRCDELSGEPAEPARRTLPFVRPDEPVDEPVEQSVDKPQVQPKPDPKPEPKELETKPAPKPRVRPAAKAVSRRYNAGRPKYGA